MKHYKFLQIFTVIMILFILEGCRHQGKAVIARVADNNLTIDDFIYDIYLTEKEGNSLNEYYNDKLGCSYWNFESNGKTMRETAKNSIITKVIMDEILSDQAKRAGLSLTKEEEAANKEAAEKLISTIPEANLKKSGLSLKILMNYYNRRALSDKYYSKLVKGFNIDRKAAAEKISLGDYREYKTECIYIMTVTEENKEIKPLNTKEQNAAYESISKALDRIKAGAGLNEAAGSDKSLIYDTRDFIAEDSTSEKAYKEAAVLLKNGEYSGIITTQFGYYIIHMLNNNSDSRYNEAVEDAVKNEEKTRFEAYYNTLKKQYSITLDNKYWDTVSIGSVTY